MPKFRAIQYDFSRGEIPELEGRPDVQFFHQGCILAKNFHTRLFGGLKVRTGYDLVQKMAFTDENVVSLEFEDSLGNGWGVIIADSWAYIIDSRAPDGAPFQVPIPYKAGEIKYLSMVQEGDVLIIAHGNHPPALIEYNGDYWLYKVATIENMPVVDDAPAWSAERGYPRYVFRWRGRTGFAGTKAYPQDYWLSRTNTKFDFERKTDGNTNDEGTLLDDSAIFGSITGEGGPIISNVYADKSLYVISTRGVYAYTSKVAPTPLNFGLVNYEPELRFPRGVPRGERVDGQLILVAGSPENRLVSVRFDVDYDQIRRSDIGQLSPKAVQNPVSLAVGFGSVGNPSENKLFSVSKEGNLSVWLSSEEQKISAWSTQEIQGKVLSVMVIQQKLYLLLKYNGAVYLLAEGLSGLDFHIEETASAAKTEWEVPSSLQGFAGVVAIADDQVQDVTAGQGVVKFTEPVNSVSFGVGFDWKFVSMPLSGMERGLELGAVASGYRDSTLRVKGATQFFINNEYINSSEKLGSAVLGEEMKPFSGNISLKNLGYSGKRQSVDDTVCVSGFGHYPLELQRITMYGVAGNG